ADPDRLARLLDGWNPARIRALGAAAVKLLVYFNPRRERAAVRQLALVAEVVRSSHALGLPVVLECLVFPTRGDGDSAAFRAEREALVIESARALNELDIDLYKAEFPLLPEQTDDAGAWLESCARLSAACRAPWALLSAGVSFERFARQLECACQAGASGFIAGRAIWQEAVTAVDPGARERFLSGEMVARLRRLTAIAEAHARPCAS
ncbi:MAG TPA: tagatose-bisphosphate aldolase, partial [Limnochordia bacterium]|nr:tagatose-bisphosphate aldolase [Limnochordia bacterium]